ncbi:hypothetical protein COV93_01660 [Candidatus Woesearchaeota archaeon CG11_big_fil_rev_8_21_14_0_20_43_8]|nr:MAG: hypothetical protein COV93_01660 [Candidatus Woesearchaeota archaeon CG11_big_fil_rev_8_21_14_0_20_43_8]PIO08925.1 MAG: nucleotide sugar dehydrogenase [Candidatus Woesearchaeota archaeon CG08_land_8_20_14_0_20_43_7]
METKICVVGLGYVGLPLALAFARKSDVVAFDINKEKIEELKDGIDRTGEISDGLKGTKAVFTNDESMISKCDFVIVAVPTPIDVSKKPDLSYVISASELVGKNLKKGAIVVFESTVYPGVTEDTCLPIIEKESGMKLGEFGIGYSPERVNPGDKEHTIEKIVKVVSGNDVKTTKTIAATYGSIITAGIHIAPDIRTAEAAKVIENIQRDLNIALMNELSMIFSTMGINTHDVLEAAGTKWNFHRYQPGLVGGHCIGVDPYYLTYKALELGYNPRVILAGRELNDSMGNHVAHLCIRNLNNLGKPTKGSKVLLMGLTFKENVSDFRNSKALDVINTLRSYGAEVIGCEPLLSKKEVRDTFGIDNIMIDDIKKIDAVILINSHNEFKKIRLSSITEKMDKPVVIDVKGLWKDEDKRDIKYSSL